MELRTLQYFLAVAREENLSQAAEILHVTQPTLSRQMMQLEEELGVKLFIRGRHMTLTESGIILRRRAEEVTALIDKIESELDDQNEVSGIISIGSGGLGASNLLLPAMTSFKDKYPKVQFQFYTNSAEHIKERLEQGLLDFGLLLEPVDISKFDYIRTDRKEKWGLLVPANSELAKKQYITNEDLTDIPIIMTGRASLLKEFESWLGRSIDTLNIFMTFNIITNVVMFVSSGHTCAITIEGAVEHFDKEKVVFRPLFPELSMTSVLAWKKFQPNFGLVNKFLEHFKSIR